MKLDLLIDATRLLPVDTDTEARRRLRHLETLLARGESLAMNAKSWEDDLLGRFGAGEHGAPPALAALTLLGEGLSPGADYWLRLDPVCLQATRSHLLLTPLPAGDLSADEAQSLADALSAHLSASGYALTVAHPQRWYLRCESIPALHTQSPQTCAGSLSEEHLPTGADGAAWRRLITEAQMLLHPLAVNAAREDAGKLPANAVWPWGGGCLPRLASPGYTSVCSSDPLALGLARAAGIEAAAVPDNADMALAQATANATTLIALTEVEGIGLAQLESTWFKPLVAALADGRLDELGLVIVRPGHPLARRVTRSYLRRWWRRARPVSNYA